MISEEQEKNRKGRLLSEVLRDNVRKYRLLRDLSHAEMAEAMQEFGFNWKPSTVAFVEGGRRQVKFDELPALSIVLHVTIPEVLDPSGPDKLNTAPFVYSVEPYREMDATPARVWIRGRLRLGLIRGETSKLRITRPDHQGRLGHHETETWEIPILWDERPPYLGE